jgi:subtilisin family serine protease
MRRVFLLLTALAVGSWLVPQTTLGSERFVDRELPQSVEALKLPTPLQSQDAKAGPPVTRSIEGRYVIRLKAPSVAEQKVRGRNARRAKRQLEVEQFDLEQRIYSLDPSARVLGQTQLVMNAIFVEVDAAALQAIAADPAVARITPEGRYEMDLSETVPYIGASAVQAAGFDGTGVRVAILDSGIDYTHANLGGPGTVADYNAAYADPASRDGLFPTDKVVEGYDFVGEVWPFGPLASDDDPIDFEGHGTHVADIAGGLGGVAPGADLYAVKVCSAVSTACSGVALIQGMEFAVDPDGDGDPSDAVDVINMSLGSDYGQPFDDDLSFAVDNATEFGVLTVSSAGNGGDRPYVTGTPSSAPTALAVAQTEVPSANFLPLMEVTAPASIADFYPAVFQSWSAPLMAPLEAPLQYGDGAGGNLLGCSLGSDPNSTADGDAPFPAGSLAGKIVLVDRGTCNFSIKIFNIQRGGGLAGIIGLVASGDPFDGALGGGGPFTIPGYMIYQADSNTLKSGLPDTIVRFDPASGIELGARMRSSSSRGPQHESTTLLKPEIGAPGASVSAVVGTGTGTSPFGGTSGASPMVAGSAALLLQAEPNLIPAEVKARLMNTGETEVFDDTFGEALAGILAPVSRIGGGEVRVDQAVFTPAAAWDDDLLQGSLSFGFIDVEDETVNLHKTVRVRNYGDRTLNFKVTPTFRYDDDAASGAVSVHAPKMVKVRPGSDATFSVKLKIKGEMLPGNYMNSGSVGGDPAGLTLNEYDGYLYLEANGASIHLPWHVLPRKAANVVGRRVLNLQDGSDEISLTNNGVGTAQNDAYSLLAVSPDQPEGGNGDQMPMPDLRAVGVNTFPVPAGFCSGQESFIWAFAISTWERQEHLVPVIHEIDLDIDQDGTFDYAVYNFDLSFSGSISDGRQVTWAENLATGSATAFFFTEHAMNTGNTVHYICAEQVGLTGSDMLSTAVDISVYAFDWYYGGPGDAIEGLTVTPLGEQYYGVPEDIEGKSNGSMTVIDFGAFPGNTPELGLMLLTNGDRGGGARGGATADTESLLFSVARPPKFLGPPARR